MIVKFKNVGQFGVIEDLPGYELPNEAWSRAVNVRFNDRYAEKVKGHSSVFLAPTVAPLLLVPLQTPTVFYWIYVGQQDIYNSQNVKMSSVSYNAAGEWTGDVFGGIPIINNGIDNPQMLYPVSVSGTFSDLSNWPSDMKAEVVKGYRGYLVALNVTESGTKDPFLIRASHQADPGFVPGSWDYTDPTKDAVRTSLTDKGGYIVDGGTLNDVFIIYRQNSMYEMRLIGGRFVFSFRKLQGDHGIYAKRCFVEFERKHCVLTNDDLMIHNGNTIQSIVDSKTRNTLFDSLSGATNNQRTFLTANYAKNEVWICFPEGADLYPTKALVWNYRHNTFGYRDLPGCNDIGYGVVHHITDTWDDAVGVWDTDSDVWDATVYDPTKKHSLIADSLNKNLFKGEDTNQFNSVNFEAILERTGLHFDAIHRFKKLKSIYPKIEAEKGTNIEITAAYQNAVGDTVSWDSGHNFVVGTDYMVNPNVSGRLLGVRFRSVENVAWKLHGYSMDIEEVGGR